MAGGSRSGSGPLTALLRQPASSRSARDYVVVGAIARPASSLVMPGLAPGIHVSAPRRKKDVDGRDKPGHDGGLFVHHAMPHRPPLLRVTYQRDEAVDA